MSDQSSPHPSPACADARPRRTRRTGALRSISLRACGPVALALVLLLAPAAADANPVFGTMNDSGGIYWRSAPDWNTPVAQPGSGVYPGTQISVSCYQAGSAVTGSAETMWVQASVAGGPGSGSGWISEHFVADSAPLDQAAPGVPHCASSPPVAPAPAPTPSSSPSGGRVACYGDYCSGQDPQASGCGNDAVTEEAVDLSSARLELRWSATCQTEWARWIQYPVGLSSSTAITLQAVQDTGYTQSASFDINGDPTDQSAESAWDENGNPISSATAEANPGSSLVISWTPMIYSPHHLVQAVIYTQCGDTSILGSVVDCGLNGKTQTSPW